MLMKEHHKNMIFINICEACLLFYRKNKTMGSFDSWCHYHANYIVNDIMAGLIPKIVIKLQFEICDYLDEIYGFSDDETFPLIYEFFKNERWVDIEEIADYTLKIQNIKP